MRADAVRLPWAGRWIWAAELVPAGLSFDPLPPEPTHNRFCLFRRSFGLDALPVGPVVARVTADSRYVLYLNGREMARGPVRSVPERLGYDEIELNDALVTGRNVLAATVRFYGNPAPWWQPALPTVQLGYGGFAFEAVGLGVVSDTSWKVRVAPYRKSMPTPTHGVATEVLDGRALPHDWREAGFDDREWEAAHELIANPLDRSGSRPGATPYVRPEPRDIAPLTALPVPLRQVATGHIVATEGDDPLDRYAAAGVGDDGFVTYDAGGITLATPALAVTGPAGSVVDVYAGEDVGDGGLADVAPRNYAFRYLLAGQGVERVEGFDAVGFRYLTVATRGGATAVEVAAAERRYPRPEGASFRCDDEMLERLWQVGVRTLEVCSTDAFVDCPGREQRAWVGDSYVHSLISLVASPDTRLVRHNLRLAASCQRRDGLLSMTAVGDLAMISLTIPDWSLHWVRALARYYEYTADDDTGRELLAAAGGVLDYFASFRGDDGLLHDVAGWVFVDWAQTERGSVVGALDALVAAAADDLADLAAAVAGDTRLVERCRGLADGIRAGFEALWDADRGVYVDALSADGPGRRVSQHTNAMAILSGVAPRERWSSMLDAVLDRSRLVVTRTPGDVRDDPGALFHQWEDPALEPRLRFDAETSVVAAQPFYRHFVHQAVMAANRADLLPGLLRDWQPQVDAGYSTFGEYWAAPPGAASRAHAWSATPTYDLTTHVLGVAPAAPGYDQIVIEPHLGPLRRASGRVPTRHGWVTVTLDREGESWVDLPAGMIGEMRTATGVVELGPGRQSVPVDQSAQTG